MQRHRIAYIPAITNEKFNSTDRHFFDSENNLMIRRFDRFNVRMETTEKARRDDEERNRSIYLAENQ